MWYLKGGNKKMKCAGYVRVSTLGQAETGESLHTQKDDIKSFAKFKKYDLVKIYEDAGISGHKAEKRPAFMQMLTDAKDKKFDYVVVSRMSRFARNTREMLNFVYDLDKYGVKFFSIKENMDSGDDYTGQLMFKILSAIAEWERESIRAQMNENKMRRWSNKKTFIGKPPYGYFWNKEKKEICVNEEEKNIYFRILDMYCNLGLSFKDIAIKLKEEGIVCKKKPFTSPTISYMFKNPAYYGNYILNKHKHETAGGRKFKRDEDGKILKENGKSIKLMKPESEWIRFEIPAFISKQKWDQIQQKTQFNKSKGKRTFQSNDYWLRDILKCGECGGVVKPHHGSKRKDGTFPRYYSCYWSFCAPKVLKTCNREKCHLPLIKAEDLEKKIWVRVMMHLSIQRGERSLSKLIDPKRYDKKLNLMKNKLAKLETDRKRNVIAKSNLYDLYADGEFDKNELSNKLIERETKIIELDGLIAESKQEIMDLEEARANDLLWKNFIKNEKETLRQLRSDLFYLEPKDKKRLIEGMTNGNRIRIDGGIENGTKVWLPGPLGLKFEKTVLLDLMERGKFSSLNKNGSDHPSADDIRRSH